MSYKTSLRRKRVRFRLRTRRSKTAQNELRELRESHVNVSRSNERLNADTEALRMQVEKIEFETKEASITMDSLKEANGELTC